MGYSRRFLARSFLPLVLSLGGLSARAVDLYVSPDGSDHNPGTLASPLATLAGARDALRALRAAGELPTGGPTTVWLRAGYYRQSVTAQFQRGDSGTPGAPIVYSAYSGEAVHLTGAVQIDRAWWRKVDRDSPVWDRIDPAARGHVYSVDLAAHGVTDGGKLSPRGFDLRAPAPLELFCDGKPLTLARWPNVGEPLARTGAVSGATAFAYRTHRPARWGKATDAWLHGFWSQDWADFHVPVGTVDVASHTITLAAAPAQYGLAADRPYYAYNLLEELDTPGEYYFDRSTGELYCWPPAEAVLEAPAHGHEDFRFVRGGKRGVDPGRGRWSVSVLASPLIALESARFLTFRGITLEAARGTLVSIAGGEHNQFDHCSLRGAGQSGAEISGTSNGLTSCQIEFCGEEGVRLSGGDRASLTPGKNYVTHSQIHATGRLGWTYKPAISLEGGCGNLAIGNRIDDLPHAAILFSGNNHLIAYNEIWHVCQLTSDSGAIYAGRSWGYRGNKIQYNYLHDIASSLGGADVNGVYLDDCMSGVTVFANLFYRIAGTAIFCGGGRDNLMTNNVIACCGAAHHDDDRGRVQITAQPGNSWNLWESLGADKVAYRGPVWAAAYPACAAIPDSAAEIARGLWRNPEHSVFSHNIGWDNRHWLTEDDHSQTGVFQVYASVEDNRADSCPLFDPALPAAAQLAADLPGFEPIPLAQIGK